MQQKMEFQNQSYANSLFDLKILSIQEQRDKLKCPNNNQAYSVCVSSACQKAGLMCYDLKCQCRKAHYKCHHILLDRVLQSIQKHQKQLPKEAKETYQAVYNVINEMIQRLSKMKTKFELEQKYFGLKDQQLQFLELINQDNIDKINGKELSKLQLTFDIDTVSALIKKQDVLKYFQQNKNYFQNLCEQIQFKFSKNSNFQSDLFNDSKIVKKQQRVLLKKWLNQVKNQNQSSISAKLLFRASENQFKSSQFHKKCDDKPNTLVIVKNQHDKIFGGYSFKQWKSLNGQPIQDKSKSSFMFSLTLKQKYQCIKPESSIYCYSEYGPIFGRGSHDFAIPSQCNKRSDQHNYFPSCYNRIQNPYQFNQSTTYLIFGSDKNHSFKIKQYEVYQIQWN